MNMLNNYFAISYSLVYKSEDHYSVETNECRGFKQKIFCFLCLTCGLIYTLSCTILREIFQWLRYYQMVVSIISSKIQ